MQLTALQPKVWWKNYYFKAFVYGIGISFLFFIPFIIYDKGYFLFYGDFNVQQVPFYQMAHDAVRSGSFGWSWTTDLGANFIGSYSFYLLGSPFFWLTIPFPSAAVPYLMGPLLILKFGCASLTGYVYLKRYVQNQNFAVIGGMLYAFSGFSVYNIFFNHFHEAIVFFPLYAGSTG
ncbi:MAG: YfhO family protein [Acutalibacteraceae bacterium]